MHAFIVANYNISALLTDPRFTPDEIMAFLSDPETQTKLTEIAKVAHLGLTIRAAEARHIAIAALEVCAKESDDLVEKRRAAFALYRATASPLIPPPGSPRASNSRSSATDPPRVSAPPPPRPRTRSHPDLQPRSVAIAAMNALIANDEPETNSGIAALAELSEETLTIDTVRTPTTDIASLASVIKPTCLGLVPGCDYLGSWIEYDSFGNNDRQHTVRFTCGHARGFLRIDIHLRPSPATSPEVEHPTCHPVLPPRPRERWLIHAITSSGGP